MGLVRILWEYLYQIWCLCITVFEINHEQLGKQSEKYDIKIRPNLKTK